MKFCTNCGAQLSDETIFCTGCGQNTAEASPAATATYVDRNISFKEYMAKYADPAHLKNIKTSAIVCYICLGITVVFSILFNYFGLIDSVILGALTLGMHLGKSKGCAIALLVVSILSTLVALVSTGSFSGWLWIVASITAVSAYSKISKAYKEFQAGAM